MEKHKESEEKIFMKPSTIKNRNFKIKKALGNYIIPEACPRVFFKSLYF